ncbi:MAG TPA: hypothetical protein VKC56_07750 [Gallionellaceae bacterium]|nr:hypothetical protein [Gallionellaceae bacterium]
MDNYFGPRRVSIRDVPGWLREAWLLFLRKPVSFVVLALVFYFLSYASRSLGPFFLLFALLLAQIFLYIGIVIAEAADESRRVPHKPTYAMIRNVLWIQIILAFVFMVLFFMSVLVGMAIAAKLPPVANVTESELFHVLHWMWPGKIAFLSLYFGLIILSLWFLSPLLALHEMGLRDALKLAKRAERMNEEVMLVGSHLPFIVFSLSMSFLPGFSLLLVFALFILFAPYQYVVYRHVFLGRKQNQPAPVRMAHRLATAPAHVHGHR